MRTYREKQSLKRNLIALAATVLFHLILFSAIYLWENRRSELDLYSGTVRVTLGDPGGQDLPSIEKPEDNSQAPEESQQQEQSVEPAEQISQQRPAVEDNSQERPLEQRQDTPAVQEQLQSEQPPPRSQEAPQQAAEPEARVVKGQAYGNTNELYLDSTGGQAGRNLWTPIYLYMPLPSTLPLNLPDWAMGDPELGITPDDDLRVFRRYYKSSAGRWELKQSPVPLERRPEIWIVLERMGYDLSRAEYKTTLLLQPVEIYYTISTEPRDDGSVRTYLSDAEIKESSGFEHIDQAVLYGFSRSSYYNDSDKDLKGRFVYRFH
ncbi:MAG: cell envelope integrity protein TolA [Spirochaetaceae bacterium]|jgi:hypothetical protein|nr:cell envelope integrity protein TolA [Spirochaetaceae bacterium]